MPKTTELWLGAQPCGIRVRPSPHVVPHDSRGPWKHLLARSGFVELVPVVMCFPHNLSRTGQRVGVKACLSQTGQSTRRL